MKTFDEVIKAMEYCQTPDQMGNCNVNCPYIQCCDPESVAIKTDALHYLKEYREMLNTRIYIPEGYTREKTGFTHQDFANTFGGEPHFIRDFMVGTSQKHRNTSQITCPKCHSEFVILPEANPPLTWDELQQMARKPVWICTDYGLCHWGIIDDVYDDEIYIDGEDYDKKDIGAEWQAYRKERE